MNKDNLSSFLFGLGIGVGLGILFAPKSGAETREYLASKADEGKDVLKQRAAAARESADEWIQKGKDAAARQKDSLAEAVEAGKQAYRDAVGMKPGGETA